ncbi:hypothetical protein LguiB_009490 [Lonicera macranthoides]
MEMAGVEEASECIAAGDSLHHDIKGANVAGIQSAFITGGIHSNELGLSKFGQVLADPSSLHELTSKFDAYPSYFHPAVSPGPEQRIQRVPKDPRFLSMSPPGEVVAQGFGSPSRSFGDNPQDIFPGITLRIVNEENAHTSSHDTLEKLHQAIP